MFTDGKFNGLAVGKEEYLAGTTHSNAKHKSGQ